MLPSKRFWLIGLLLCLSVTGVFAQAPSPTPAPDPAVTRPFRDAVLYAGPGQTYQQLAIVQAGIDVQIVERNRIGNWLHVMRWDARGNPTIDGWVMTGYLSLEDHLRFSDVPENDAIADADLSSIRNETLAALYAAPVISDIPDTMREVYERGQELGNQPNMVTKVGDSVSADPLYLTLMMRTDHVLGPYDYLQDTLDYYGEGLREDQAYESIAAQVGMATYVVFDPAWAHEQCEPNEIPLDCEYRLRMPVVSFIMFGGNDVRHITVEVYEGNLRNIVNKTLERGIIPVLSTFSYDPDGPYNQAALVYNRAVIDLADELDVPLINLWAAAHELPKAGLDGDDVHMAHSGFRYLKFDTGHESWYGVSLRNLLTLRMLDEIHEFLAEAS